MSRRPPFPNLPHWRRAVDCAQRVCGSRGLSWRRKLETRMGIERGQLRAEIDRPMTLDEERDLDDRLAAFLRHYSDISYARVQRLDHHLCRLVEARNDREAARVKPEPVDISADWEWEEMFPEFFAQLRVVNQEAA